MGRRDGVAPAHAQAGWRRVNRLRARDAKSGHLRPHLGTESSRSRIDAETDQLNHGGKIADHGQMAQALAGGAHTAFISTVVSTLSGMVSRPDCQLSPPALSRVAARSAEWRSLGSVQLVTRVVNLF